MKLFSMLSALLVCKAFTIPPSPALLTRRALLGMFAAGALPVSPMSMPNTAPPPIALIGPDGETGMRVLDILVSKGIPVQAIHHTARPDYKQVVRGIHVRHVVSSMEDANIAESIQGCAAVIVVAGVKPRGGKNTVREFDTSDPIGTFAVGYPNVAKACIESKVPRLVLLSSSCFYDSEVCECMGRGEQGVKDMYEKAPPGVGYTIVHSGRLYNGEARGAEEIEINQGLAKSGLISRQDIAQLLVEAATDDVSTAGRKLSFEAYYSDSAQPRDLREAVDRCKENNIDLKQCIVGQKQDNGHVIIYPTGNERHSRGAWRNLLHNLSEDRPTVIQPEEFGVGSG